MAMFIGRARAGRANLSLHDLGASHATALLDLGVRVYIVAERIGDDPATLLRSYARRMEKADAI
jgi:integrase